MNVWQTVAFFVFISIAENVRRSFFSPGVAKQGTQNFLGPLFAEAPAWVSCTAGVICSLIGMVVLLFAVRLTTPLVFSSTAGAAVLVAAAYFINERWRLWGNLIWDLMVIGIGLLIYEFVPGAGFEGVGMFICLLGSVLSIAGLCGLFTNKRPDDKTGEPRIP